MLNYLLFLTKLGFFSLIDICALGFFQGPTIFLSRCFFYAVLVSQGSFRLVCAAGFFALLPSFIITGSLGADLVIMIPLGILVYNLSRLVELPLFMRALIVTLCLFIHALIMDVVWAGMALNMYSLFMHFLVALFLV